METLSIPGLLIYLQSHPFPTNFNRAAGILQSRHDSLLDELTIKEADLVDLRSRCKTLELQLQESLTKAEDARKRAQTAEDKLDFFIQAHRDLYPDRIIQVSDSEDDATTAVVEAADGDDGKDHRDLHYKSLCDDACKRAQTAEDKLDFFIQPHKDLYPDRIIQVSDSEDDAAAAAAVVDAGVITHEDGDDGRAHLPTPLPRFRSPFVFYSDNDDEGGSDCEEEDVVCHLRQMIAEAKEEDVVCHLRKVIAEAKDTEGQGSSVPKSGRKRRKVKRSKSIMRSKRINGQ